MMEMKRRRMRLLALSRASLLLTGVILCLSCPLSAHQPPEQAESNQRDLSRSPAEPNIAKTLPVSVDPKTFRLGPDDVVLIRVWREPDLSGPVVIRPDGKITLPLAGEIQAEGRTPEQLSAAVADAVSKFMNRPEVSVLVQSVRSKKYYLSGEIARPGVFPLSGPTTILQALTEAGGFRDFANTKKIVVMRGPKRMKFNYNDVIKGKNLGQNILLENGDHVFVP